MKEIDIREAFRLTSPNPLILGGPETEALLAWKGCAEVETAHKG